MIDAMIDEIEREHCVCGAELDRNKPRTWQHCGIHERCQKLREHFVAALEDRQEVAHNAVGEIQCRYCLRMVSVYRADVDERKLCEFCWKSAHPEESFRPGVPSEATPSKENAPLTDHLFGSCRNSRDPELCARCERIQNAAASAPEGVQGKTKP